MKILVTGGAGFIGSNFIYYVLSNYPNDKVVCLDNLTYAGNLDSLSDALNNKDFSFYKGDINEPDYVNSLFEKEKFDIVVNFAAESHVDRSLNDPSIFLKTNILGTQVLLDASRKYGVTRFHQVSTDEVYGDLPLDKPELLFDESSAIKPSSPYSASKASADFLVLAYYKTFGVPVTITRCSNNYGPYQFPEKLIPLVISRSLSNNIIPVYGKGLNVRDWLFVEDHCSAIDLVMRKGKNGSVYNVGGNNEVQNIELVKLIISKLNKSSSLISYVKDRLGHDLRYAVNSSKIKNELGWEPKISFEKGLNETIKWYKENEEWLQRILNGEYKTYYTKMYE